MIRTFKHLLSFYVNDLKLQKKLVISHLILVLTPLLIISLLFYSKLSTIIQVNIMDAEQKTMSQTNNYIEYVISRISDSADTIMNDPIFTHILSLSEEKLNTLLSKDASLESDILTFLHSVNNLIDRNVITDIKIYLTPTYSPLYEDNALGLYSTFQPLSSVATSTWHTILSDPQQSSTLSDKYTLVCPKDYLTTVEKNTRGSFSVVRKISPTYAPEELSAYISLYFSKDNLQDVLQKSMLSTQGVTYLINKNDFIVSASDYQKANQYLIRHSALSMLLEEENTWTSIPFASERAYVSYKSVAGSDWYLISVIPSTDISNKNNSVFFQFVLIYLLVAGLIYIFALALSNSITKRVRILQHQMVSVKSGLPQPLNLKKSQDEIGELIDSYNYMSEEINSLTAEKINILNELNASELKALQTQIHPHFLYNTLDMINWLAKKGENEKVSEAICSLSKFYKLTLSKGNIIVTVREELEHVSLYVKIQNMRYDNKIHLTLDVAEEVLSYQIPKIVFQPIVENSIQHGIFGKSSKEGSIQITGRYEEGILLFTIRDDGIGIDSHTLSTLLSDHDFEGGSDDNDNMAGSHIGISNTHQRLQLFYGDKQFGLHYSSRKNVGTEVVIRIPAQKDGQFRLL